MSWMNDRPSWLPPIPPPHRGRAFMVVGLVLVVGTFIYIFYMSYVGGTHTLYTLLPLAAGLVCLTVGLTRRNEGR
ncbi:hypothetical protein BJ994_001961 [Arthrobacter pigmenti]|uniref:Uncharacterized protein n=1 Tax=Arthrobacter pigmenti TaxID=271432 RepID=A0A846RT88_9MICC|nr:hypothetical protein [Arthrobacter pigmenti]NJC22885.1 hypothetical protein [Arthrobacter pigmenti]